MVLLGIIFAVLSIVIVGSAIIFASSDDAYREMEDREQAEYIAQYMKRRNDE